MEQEDWDSHLTTELGSKGVHLGTKTTLIKKEIWTLCQIGISLLILTALAYFNPEDPSFYSSSAPPKLATNKVGVFGSYLSGFLIYWLGSLAWMLPIYVLYPVVNHYALNRSGSSFKQFATGLSLIILSLSVLVSKGLGFIEVTGIPFNAAGAVGQHLHLSIYSYFGEVGSILIPATILAVGSSLCFNIYFSRKFFIWSKRFSTLTRNTLAACICSLKYLSRKSDPIPELDKGSNPSTSTCPLDIPIPSSSSKIASTKPTRHHMLMNVFQAQSMQDSRQELDLEHQQRCERSLLQALQDFGISGSFEDRLVGPSMTTYLFKAKKGTKLSTVSSLCTDLALNIGTNSLFILPVPSHSAIGFQIPNRHRQAVYLSNIAMSSQFEKSPLHLPIIMGLSAFSTPIIEDLSAAPHILVAGSTGSGKSVGIHSIICSLIMSCSPQKLEILLVDPKQLEFAIYNELPHLRSPIITSASDAIAALNGLVDEMERRYALMQKAQVRSISAYNEKLGGTMPYIVAVIDEFADLMTQHKQEIEALVCRLAQKSRACGIHMLVATQRPSVDIVTGTIKVNFPARIAYRLSSGHDSRTIINEKGAEKLLGHGDMLFLKPGESQLNRIQGPLISFEEIKALVHTVSTKKHEFYLD